MKTGLRERLEWKPRSEERVRSCSGKRDPCGHAQKTEHEFHGFAQIIQQSDIETKNPLFASGLLYSK